MNILVTNDDGIIAPGIAALVEAAKQFGDVTVVAPDSPQSGKGHAITLTRPLRLTKVKLFEGTQSYECDGTPADCVKMAKHILFKNDTIDLCLSGINHGSNAGINIIYSGTMAAAREASIEGIDSIGFSVDDYAFDADFSAAQAMAIQVIEQVITNQQEHCKLLNVNIPKLPLDQIKGIKVCKQGKSNWIEEFKEGEDPRGSKYYWLAGEMTETKQLGSDLAALSDGYVSVVPSTFDLTMHKGVAEYSFLNQNF